MFLVFWTKNSFRLRSLLTVPKLSVEPCLASALMLLQLSRLRHHKSMESHLFLSGRNMPGGFQLCWVAGTGGVMLLKVLPAISCLWGAGLAAGFCQGVLGGTKPLLCHLFWERWIFSYYFKLSCVYIFHTVSSGIVWRKQYLMFSVLFVIGKLLRDRVMWRNSILGV